MENFPSFPQHPHRLKDLAKILLYFAAVILGGALLAPPLYFAAHALAAHGIFPSLTTFSFQKYFNRASLLCAFLFLWPAIRSLHITSTQELGITPNPRWRQHLLAGLAIASLAVALLASTYLALGFYKIRPSIAWTKIPVIALSALIVAFLEEALFRGAILGLLRRSLSPLSALLATSALFAIVHFLKPDESYSPTSIGWLSGFDLIPHTFHQFANPLSLLAGFSTLFTLGWLCGSATLRTRSLWLSIGLHAGVVLVKMSFSVIAKFAIKPKLRPDYLPWIGDRFENGLLPVAALLLAIFLAHLYTSHEHRLLPPTRL